MLAHGKRKRTVQYKKSKQAEPARDTMTLMRVNE